MTMISQDEIVSNAKTVTKGLEALRQEHESILGGIKSSLEHADLGAENTLIQAGRTEGLGDGGKLKGDRGGKKRRGRKELRQERERLLTPTLQLEGRRPGFISLAFVYEDRIEELC